MKTRTGSLLGRSRSCTPDRFDRTNAPRQLMFGGDIGRPKAVALAENRAPHMIAGGVLTALAMPFERAIADYPRAADVLVVLVDNNPCRLTAVPLAKHEHVPAVFSMLSLDGMRANTFLQEAAKETACLWCALPNIDPTASAPCAAAITPGCRAAATHASFFVYRALMGWPAGVVHFDWRSTDLLAGEPDHSTQIQKRLACTACGAQPRVPCC